jgi:hypothetical protein
MHRTMQYSCRRKGIHIIVSGLYHPRFKQWLMLPEI